MCEFQSGTHECRGDGYIWDADHDGYDPNDKSWPCPNCNTIEYLKAAKEEAESSSYYFGIDGHGTGVTIWENAVKVAKYWNEDATEKALIEIGVVEALYDDDSEDEGFGVKKFVYEKAA